MSLEGRIHLKLGDITRLDVEVVVTAANSALRGGSGVDGAVHAAAGPKLVEASMAQAPCPAGEARITDAFELNCQKVIHAVGPIFKSFDQDEPILASAYENSLSLAAENNLNSIAFPCISTGVYGYPPDAACNVAIKTVAEWAKSNDLPKRVVFCCFLDSDFELYRERLEELGLYQAPSDD